MTSKLIKTLMIPCLASGLNAAVITATANSPAGADGYTWNMALDSASNDTTSFAGTVGSWAWEDASLGLGNGIGWRHQSDWIAVSLTNASSLQVEMTRNDEVADAKLFPSFTIYRNLTSVIDKHFFENNTDLSWDPNLIYEGHLANSTLGSASQTFDLPAGDYTLVLGGNALSEPLAVNVNYLTTLSTSPSSIPEPSTSLLAMIAGLGFLSRRSR